MCSIAGLESILSVVLRDVSFALCIFAVSSGSMFLSDPLLRIARYYGARTPFADKVRKILPLSLSPQFSSAQK